MQKTRSKVIISFLLTLVTNVEAVKIETRFLKIQYNFFK